MKKCFKRSISAVVSAVMCVTVTMTLYAGAEQESNFSGSSFVQNDISVTEGSETQPWKYNSCGVGSGVSEEINESAEISDTSAGSGMEKYTKAAAASYSSSTAAEYANQVAIMVNAERAAYGLEPLRVSPRLSEAAAVRAQEIQQTFSHTRPDGSKCFTAITELGISYSAAAENVAYGYKDPEAVMNGWMNSSGHRSNILDANMQYIGIGVAYNNGTWYWTQFFVRSNYLSDGSYLPGEDREFPPEYDINNDGNFDIDDVIDLARSILTVTDPLKNPYLPDGDRDGNGRIDIDDVILLARELIM